MSLVSTLLNMSLKLIQESSSVNLQRAEVATAVRGRSTMTQLGGVEREAMITWLTRQADDLIAWQSARQQVRSPTYSLGSMGQLLIGAAQEIGVDSIVDRAEVTARERAGEDEEMPVQGGVFHGVPPNPPRSLTVNTSVELSGLNDQSLKCSTAEQRLPFKSNEFVTQTLID